MWKKDNIQDELKEVAPVLTNASNRHVYQVDTSYFEHLPALIMNKIRGEQDAFAFDGNKRQTPFATPAGYFENLAGNIMASIRKTNNVSNEVEQELIEIAPALARLPRTNVYTVPTGYFEQFEVTPVVTKPAKVVSMFSVRKAFRYVAAAVVIGIMVIAGYLFLDKPSSGDYTGLNVTAAVDALSEEDILSYLQEPATAMQVTSFSARLPETEEDFEEEIEELSDEDLQQFLKENPEPIPAANSGI